MEPARGKNLGTAAGGGGNNGYPYQIISPI
jgi:hypothetical protein